MLKERAQSRTGKDEPKNRKEFCGRALELEDYYELLIPGLRLWISLGCTREEKAHSQPVDIDIKMIFLKEPLGCQSDQLAHVCCYKNTVDRVIESIQGVSFNLIEHLAARIFDVISQPLAQEEVIVEIVIVKPHHPVPHVQKGIVFKYCRRLPQKSSSA